MKRTRFFSLATVPAVVPVTPSSKGPSPLRALAGLFFCVLLSGLGFLAPLPSWAATGCGGAGQRACCVNERIPSCYQGLVEYPGCTTGNCTCGGVNPFGIKSIGHCAAPPPPPPPISPCGGAGQRACCVTERIPSCYQGLVEYDGCTTGNCTCGGPNPGGLVKSIGHCAAPPPPPPPISPCGDAGQRACCVTERFPSCYQGLIEYDGCTTGNCTCGGPNPGGLVKSIGYCAAPPVTPQQPATSGPAGVGQQMAPATQQNVGEVPGGLPASPVKGADGAQQVAPTMNQGVGGAQQVAPTMNQGVGGSPASPVKGTDGVQQVAPTINQGVGGLPAIQDMQRQPVDPALRRPITR